MKLKQIMRAFSVLLAVALVLVPTANADPIPTSTPIPTQIPTETINSTPTEIPLPTDVPAISLSALTDGTIRVWLTKLGKNIKELSVQLDGCYSLEDNPSVRFTNGATITIVIEDGNLYLRSGGMEVLMGPKFRLTRYEDGKNLGITFVKPNKMDNPCVGDLVLVATDNGIMPVLELDIEKYLYGVVPYEMSDSFPLEALKSQAIAARTYALSKIDKTRDYDVRDSTMDQVFKGHDFSKKNAIRAVDETKGICGIYKGELAVCYYAASNGGQTELANSVWSGNTDDGYLDVRLDPYDIENPSSQEKKSFVPKQPGVTGDLNKALSKLLKKEIGKQLTVLGYLSDSEYIRIDEFLDIAPINPDRGAGSLHFTQVRFNMKVSGMKVLDPNATPTATPIPTPTPTPLPTPSPTPAPTRRPLFPFFNWWGTSTVTPTPMVVPTDTPTPTSTPIPLEPISREIIVHLNIFDDLKDNLDLKLNSSPHEVISVIQEADGYTLIARRFGHGVGMSQRGAQWMAKQYNMPYQEILAFYYPGLLLDHWNLAFYYRPLPDSRWPRFSPKTGSNIAADDHSDAPLATQELLPTPAEGERIANVMLSSKDGSLNIRSGPSGSNSVIGYLFYGYKVVVKSVTNGWANINLGDKDGYVSASYLEWEDGTPLIVK